MGKEKKNNKKKIWTDESKKVMTEGWKKKWRNTKSEKHKKGVFEMEDSQKKTKKSRMKRSRRKEKKNDETEKKEDPPKKTFKKQIFFQTQKSEKIGETRIEYKRDVKHIKIQEHFRKSSFFFFERIAEKWWDVSKTKGFFGSRSWKKQKIGDAKSDHKSSKKKKKSKTLVLRRKEKWNKKRHVFLKEKMKKTNWKSWKKIGDEKPKFFFGWKKTKAKTNQRRETRREKVKEEERFVRREQKEVVQKGSEKTFILFLFENKCQKKEWKHNLSEKRGHLFSTKRFLA